MALRFSPPESCKLYNLNVEELLRDKEEYKTVLKKSLGRVGVAVERLEMMAKNPRHQLVLLLGPTDTWDEHGPTVYCAIQVCLEGKIPQMPELDEKDPFKQDIKKSFQWFPQLPYDLLIGITITQVFLLPDVPEEEYKSTSLKLLTMFCNGDVAQHDVEEVPQREANILTQLHTKQQRIHYLGTLTNPLIGDVQHWEGQGFKVQTVLCWGTSDSVRCVMILPLHDYETFINNEYNDCSLDDLFKAFVCIFTSLLRYWRDFDHILALRILRQNIALVQQGEPGTRKKPWTTIAAEERMESFILHQRNMEFVSDLIPGIAQSYFGGALPIMLAENEESVLLLMGLQGHAFGDIKEAMHLGDAETLLCFSRVFSAVMDYFNTLSPEVADD